MLASKSVLAPRPLRVSQSGGGGGSSTNVLLSTIPGLTYPSSSTPPLSIDYLPEETEFTDTDESHPFIYSDCLKSPGLECWRQDDAEMDELQSIFIGNNKNSQTEGTTNSLESEYLEILSPKIDFPDLGPSPAPTFRSPSRAQNPIPPSECWKFNSPPREKRKNRSFSACK